MSATFKDPFEAFRKDEWPFRHDEFDAWPRHARPPMHLRSSHLAFDPLTAASLIATGVGTAISAGGSIAAGQNAQKLGQFQSQELTQQAETDVATSQRKMLEAQRKGGLLQSELVARAAGGGANPAVGSDVKLASDIAGRTQYQSLMDLSQGQNAGAGLTNQASGDLYSGNLSAAYAPYAAIGSIASGAGSMAGTLSKAGYFAGGGSQIGNFNGNFGSAPTWG